MKKHHVKQYVWLEVLIGSASFAIDTMARTSFLFSRGCLSALM